MARNWERESPTASCLPGTRTRWASRSAARLAARLEATIEKIGVIHWLPGKAAMLNPSHSWIIGLYNSTGIDKASDTQKRWRNIASCPVWSA